MAGTPDDPRMRQDGGDGCVEARSSCRRSPPFILPIQRKLRTRCPIPTRITAPRFPGVLPQRQLAQQNYFRAEDNFRKARQAVDEYLTQVSQSKLLNVPGLQPLRKELLESARSYYQEFLRDRGDDPTVRAEAAEAWYRLGVITHDIGSHAEALEQLQKAGALYEALARDNPDEVRYLYKLAMCLNDIGRQHYSLGSAADTLEANEQAFAIREEVVRRAPTVPEYQKELAISC